MRLAVVVGIAVASGCNTPVDDAPQATLWLEPATVDLDVDLAAAAPSVELHAFVTQFDGSRTEVTAGTTFTLAGAPIGTIAGASLTSDGATGGLAQLHATYGALAVDVPATAHVHERRIESGTAPGAVDAFATATTTPVDAQLDPPDGAVLPAALGSLELSFAALDTDDTHQIRLTAPYLDVEIVAPAVAGPRELTLSTLEWRAVTHTARGGTVQLDVASLASAAPATARVATAALAIADLAPSALLVSGAIGETITDGSPNRPGLWRYDMAGGVATAMAANPTGACVGCHLAVSPDGTRIAALLVGPTGANLINGILLDRSGAVIAQSGATAPWATAGFDPGGALVTGWQGNLALRDPDTGAVLAPIAMPDAATAPVISSDGSALAYVTLDAGFGDAASQPSGNALRIRPWDARTATVGAPIELARNADGVELPSFSSDGRWLAYGIGTPTPDFVSEVPSASIAVRTDGSGTTVQLTADARDQLAHFASPVAATSVGGRAAEPMVWVAVVSTRTVGGATTAAQQLWLEAFYPDRGVIAPAFHLPGQPALLQVLHGPVALPSSPAD